MNGRFWRVLQLTGNGGAFVLGAQEMLRTQIQRNTAERKTYEIFFSRTHGPDELSEALNRFFAAPENLSIPMIDALVAISLKANGVDTPTVTGFVDALRSRALLTDEQFRAQQGAVQSAPGVQR